MLSSYVLRRPLLNKFYLKYTFTAPSRNVGSWVSIFPLVSAFPLSTWEPRVAKTRVRNQFRHGSVAFGPQHPAAHGILRIQMLLSGEVLRWVDPQFGFLHRGTEKLMVGRTLLQSLPYFDRFDYVANLFQEHAFCLAVESLTLRSVPLTATVQIFRSLFDEISRLLNHLLTLSATALDINVMGPIFWAFEEREFLLEVCERASGARMHTALYRPFSFDTGALSLGLLQDLVHFLTRCTRSLAGAFLSLLQNRSFKTRLSYVGQVSPIRAAAYGISGLLARSTGKLRDLRLQDTTTHHLYRACTLRTFLGRRGDNYDRFLLRVKEASESFRILGQLIQLSLPALGLGGGSSLRLESDLQSGTVLVLTLRAVETVVLYPQKPFSAYRAFTRSLGFWKVTPSRFVASLAPKHSSAAGSPSLLDLEAWSQRGKFASMEAVIGHFRLASSGWATTAGFSYQAVESPKGEVGVTLVTSGGLRPVRLKLRTPVAHNMHLIPAASVGSTFADLVATFCSLDIVMGEIDR